MARFLAQNARIVVVVDEGREVILNSWRFVKRGEAASRVGRWSEGRGDKEWSLVWARRCRRPILLVRDASCQDPRKTSS